MMLPLSGHLDGEGPNALNKDIRYRGGLQGFFNVSRPESRLRSSSADREQCADAKMIKLPRSGEELAYDAAVAEPTFKGPKDKILCGKYALAGHREDLPLAGEVPARPENGDRSAMPSRIRGPRLCRLEQVARGS